VFVYVSWKEGNIRVEVLLTICRSGVIFPVYRTVQWSVYPVYPSAPHFLVSTNWVYLPTYQINFIRNFEAKLSKKGCDSNNEKCIHERKTINSCNLPATALAMARWSERVLFAIMSCLSVDSFV